MPNFQAKKFKPVASGFLPHRLNGRRCMYIKFKGKFTIDEIRDFAQNKSNELANHDRIVTMQVGVMYSLEHDRSGKMTGIGEEVDVRDLRDMYDYDLGDINGFYLYLS